MKKIKNLIALSAMFALTTTPLLAQDDGIPAYTDSSEAGYMSAVLPVTALVIAGVIIATTDRHHHHGSSGSSGHSSHASSSSSSHSH